jgi:hypothetical protein
MVIYAPEDDARLYPDQPKRRVVSWAIRIEWDNGEEEDLIDVPDDVSGPIDLWLSEVEQDQHEFNGQGI